MRLPWICFAKQKDELNEELRAHLRMAIVDRMERGESEEEARHDAMRELGNVPLIEDVTRAMWGGMWLERVLQDVRYALRQLRHAPGFAVTVVMTLALGLGAAVAMYTVVDRVMLRPLPYRNAGSLVKIETLTRNGGSPLIDIEEWQARSRTLESVAFYYADDSNAHLGFLDGRGESTQVVEPHVSANLFPTLGVHAAIGRTFLEGDGGAVREEDAHALVLSDGVWRGAFGADPHIVGRVVRVSGESFTVIGVMPRGFTFPYGMQRPAVWMPIVPDAADMTRKGDETPRHDMIARLKPGVSVAAAAAELKGIQAGNLSAAIKQVTHPEFNVRRIRLRFEPDGLRITGITDFIGEYEGVISTQYAGETVEADFNGQYLLDFLAIQDVQVNVRIQLNDAATALEMCTEGQQTAFQCRYLCMQMRPSGPARLQLPTDFANSVSIRIFESLIRDVDFEAFEERQTSMLVISRESIAVVIRDGHRLHTHQAAIGPNEARSDGLKLLVPHGIMSKIQRLLREPEAQWVELAENDNGARFRIGVSANAWPKRPEREWRNDAVIPPTEDITTVPSEIFRALADRTLFAIPKGASRYTPDAALLAIKPDSISMVGKDGHRLSIAETGKERMQADAARKDILIAREIIPEILRMLENSEPRDLEFAVGPEAFSCRVGNQVLSWANPCSEGKYPVYESLLLEERANVAVCQANELRNAIRRECGPDGWNQKTDVTLRLSGGHRWMGIESKEGERQETVIGVRYSGEALAVSFHPPYLLNFLDAVADSLRVQLAFKDAKSVMEMSLEDDEAELRWRYLVMPRKG
jgi:DNA polymerase III sliding clamp (beta) subunit (PCNA family)